MSDLLRRAADHDANEERRYLHEGRLNLTWSWLWLNWGLGPGFCYDPHGSEAWSGWVALGPLTLEVYARRGDA